ncbi:hypothetical protein AAHA92_26898 [Salvia divinorum]|uniref:DC1 domain-containing protein n=1 Tax=Salvia divinorum TaxID=28513 RepID=A0ABD1G1Y4_SALDI
MSGKEKNIEMDEEKEMVDHWSHEHPLTLLETHGRDYCYGCERRLGSGEQAYGCIASGCEYSNLLHEECAAVAREIGHSLHHPQHILIQRHPLDLRFCDICGRMISSIGYKCTSSGCWFQMHLRCAQGNGVIDATTRDGQQRRDTIRHPSHPSHELKLLRRRCSFKCDACGTKRGGNSYTCTTAACQYWIHERCASLPRNIERGDHPHSLSVSFYVPQEYVRFDYKCDVCSISFLPNYWIYHCSLCRYIVHVKCAFDKPPHITEYNLSLHHSCHYLSDYPSFLLLNYCRAVMSRSNDANTSNRKHQIHLPTDEVSGKIITPFVMRQRRGRRRGRALIPPIIPHDDELVDVKYKFLPHQHELTLVSSDQNQEEEQQQDEENYGKRSELICDGCITPISSSTGEYYYMSCSECKYNLHIACFHLPPHISSLPPHHQLDHHHLYLESCDKLQPWVWQECSVCGYNMNGLFYNCTVCNFKEDIKCASMPDTIHHEAHPQHLLNHVTEDDLRRDVNSSRLSCAAGCDISACSYDCYRCDVCRRDRHEKEGFYCALCNFFICLYYDCGREMITDGDMKAID